MLLPNGSGVMGVAETLRAPDLLPRVASAVVMLALVGFDIWLGGWAFAAFVALVAVAVYWEWWGLARRLASGAGLVVWMLGGALYLGLALMTLIALRTDGLAPAVTILLAVIAVDIGAYFAGRMIGGPKIAPRISPSKTWAGLGGGIVAATLTYAALIGWVSGSRLHESASTQLGLAIVAGPLTAIIAQVGDFFESWMKRRAGLKDSGSLIPGHGGLFDRTDGMIAVLFAIGLFMLATIGWQLASGGSLLPTPA